MSTQFQPAPPMPSYQPQAPKPKRAWLLPLLLVAAILVGFGVGAAKPAPDPVTVEKRVEVPVEKIVTKEVPVTPAACGTALDRGADIIGMSGTVVGLLSDSLGAAGNLDAATIRNNSDKIREQTAKLKEITPEFQLSRDLCQASLK